MIAIDRDRFYVSVEYDGDSFFFAWGDSRVAKDIEREPTMAMTLQGKADRLGEPPLFISVEGSGEIIRDKAAFAGPRDDQGPREPAPLLRRRGKWRSGRRIVAF